MEIPVLAYIDPGTGTLLLQFLLGAVVGGTVFFRSQFARVVGWIRNIASPHQS